MRLTDVSFRDWKVAVCGAAVAAGRRHGLAWACTAGFGLAGRDAAMLWCLAPCRRPCSIFSFAERYRQEPEQVASIVLIGNLAALVFLPSPWPWRYDSP